MTAVETMVVGVLIYVLAPAVWFAVSRLVRSRSRQWLHQFSLVAGLIASQSVLVIVGALYGAFGGGAVGAGTGAFCGFVLGVVESYYVLVYGMAFGAVAAMGALRPLQRVDDERLSRSRAWGWTARGVRSLKGFDERKLVRRQAWAWSILMLEMDVGLMRIGALTWPYFFQSLAIFGAAWGLDLFLNRWSDRLASYLDRRELNRVLAFSLAVAAPLFIPITLISQPMGRLLDAYMTGRLQDWPLVASPLEMVIFIFTLAVGAYALARSDELLKSRAETLWVIGLAPLAVWIMAAWLLPRSADHFVVWGLLITLLSSGAHFSSFLHGFTRRSSVTTSG
jgi:hypothetical protein